MHFGASVYVQLPSFPQEVAAILARLLNRAKALTILTVENVENGATTLVIVHFNTFLCPGAVRVAGGGAFVAGEVGGVTHAQVGRGTKQVLSVQ
jgi:hypothetical protein